MLIYRFFDLNAQHLVTIGQERKSPKERPAVFTHQNVSSGKVAGGIFVDMQVRGVLCSTGLCFPLCSYEYLYYYLRAAL